MSLRQTLFMLPALSLAATFSFGCSDDGGDDPLPPEPIEYYSGELSAELGGDGNQVTCETCHSAGGEQAGYSGYTMQDIAYKASWKNGNAATLLDAVNECVTGWMNGTALTLESDEYILLEEFLQSISDEANTTPNEIMPEVLADDAAYETAYAGIGDAAAGAAKYDLACAKCHDNSLIVGAATSLPKATIAGFGAGRIAQKVRTSGPPDSDAAGNETTPGPMPFFEVSDLSVQDLADIIAHLTNS